MPSTVVHLAFAGLITAALLPTSFDRRALLVVFAVTAFPDLDSFVALVSVAGHRTVLHNLVIPFAVGAIWTLDTRVRDRSFVRERWGEWGVRVGWVSLVALVVSGVGLDFVEAGVNPLWPLHDQFYVLNGKIEISDQRGIVQTFVDLSPDSGSSGDGGSVGPESLGSSQEVNMSTGVDPNPDGSDGDAERLFPVVRSGWQLLLLAGGGAVTGARLWMEERDA